MDAASSDPAGAVSRLRRGVTTVLAVAVVLVALIAVLGLPALLAAPDAPAPAGAEQLADDIRSSLGPGLEVRVPPYRVALRSWQKSGASSFRVVAEVYDLRFGIGGRSALVAAPCWQPGGAFSAAWVDDPVATAELRRSFQAGAAARP